VLDLPGTTPRARVLDDELDARDRVPVQVFAVLDVVVVDVEEEGVPGAAGRLVARTGQADARRRSRPTGHVVRRRRGRIEIEAVPALGDLAEPRPHPRRRAEVVVRPAAGEPDVRVAVVAAERAGHVDVLAGGELRDGDLADLQLVAVDRRVGA